MPAISWHAGFLPIKLSRLDSLRDSPVLRRPNHHHYTGIPGVNIVRVIFRSTYHISNSGARILQGRGVLGGQVASKVLARPRRGLWIYYSIHLPNVKPVMKNWLQRRLRSALVEELQKRGFDKDGKRTGNCTGRVAERKDLFGTLEIGANPALEQASGGEVRTQTRLMVERLEQMCEGWRKNGERGGVRDERRQ